MSNKYKLYLDQMFNVDVAQGLGEQGYDVLRAYETHQDRADDQQILQDQFKDHLVILPGKRAKWVLTSRS